MLFSKLACFAHAFNLLLVECQESDDDSFRLHLLEFVEIDVANLLAPQFYVRISFRAFCEHGRFHLVRVENEYSAFSSFERDDSALFVDEAPVLVKSDLHTLLNHLADRDQILRVSG